MSNTGRAIKVINRQLEHFRNSDMIERITIVSNDSNIFENNFEMIISADSLWKGYIIRGTITFPQNYPFIPPTIKIISDIFHPNVYENGKVCLSILNTQVDETGYIKEEELWSPSLTIASIFTILEHLIAEPNIESPANLDACILYRNDKERLAEILNQKLTKQ